MSEEKIEIKKDCVFYKDNRHCTALKEMYCHKEICSFYDNGESQQVLRMSVAEFEKAKADAVKEFAEQVKMAFYYEFDELIPSIMADKIDNLAKKGGNLNENYA
jgi:hypothetical protein